jgi:hypothetical protein
VARLTKQIVIMMTETRGSWIKETALDYGLSEAEIARDSIELGSALLDAHYRERGITKLSPAQRKAHKTKVEADRRRRSGSSMRRAKSRTVAREKAPQAQFVAPAV